MRIAVDEGWEGASGIASRLKIALAVVLAGCTAPFFIISWHWPLVGDASLIHYICFLMDHGMAPYRDLGDMNMPAAFMVEWAAMHSYGMGEVAWRLFDFSLLGVAAASFALIAGRGRWLAGMFAACLLILVHGRDGFAQAGQRDLVVAVSLLLATALLFTAVRRRKGGLAGGFGLFAGVAGAVKPTAVPLALVLLWLGTMALRRRGVRAAPFLGYGVAGALVGPMVSIAFLMQERAVVPFFESLRTVVPFYVSLGHRPLGYLLVHSLSPMMAVVAFWAAVIVLDRPRAGWERMALLAGAGFGLLSYVVQARGFPYYRYTLLVYLLPLMGIDLESAAQRAGTGWRRICGRGLAWAGFAAGVLVIAPVSILQIRHFDPGGIDFVTSLEAHLNELGGAALSGNVQCIDSVSGCGTTLYRMRLVQATGVLSDFLLFGSGEEPAQGPEAKAVEATRARMAEALRVRPPKVIVVTSWLHIDGPGEYRKLERWPWFAEFLGREYRLSVEWKPTRQQRWWGRAQWPDGYRIYVLKDDHSRGAGS